MRFWGKIICRGNCRSSKLSSNQSVANKSRGLLRRLQLEAARRRDRLQGRQPRRTLDRRPGEPVKTLLKVLPLFRIPLYLSPTPSHSPSRLSTLRPGPRSTSTRRRSRRPRRQRTAAGSVVASSSIWRESCPLRGSCTTGNASTATGARPGIFSSADFFFSSYFVARLAMTFSSDILTSLHGLECISLTLSHSLSLSIRLDSGLVHPHEAPEGEGGGGVFCKRCFVERFGEGGKPLAFSDTAVIAATDGSGEIVNIGLAICRYKIYKSCLGYYAARLEGENRAT